MSLHSRKLGETGCGSRIGLSIRKDSFRETPRANVTGIEIRSARDDLAGDVHIGVTGPLGALYFRAMRRGWRRFLDEFGLSGALQGNPRSGQCQTRAAGGLSSVREYLWTSP